jgi:hypothetical protein
MNPKMAFLLKEGVSINTLEKMNYSQIGLLYEKIKKSKMEPKEAITKTTTSTTYSQDEVKGKTFTKDEDLNVTLNQDGTVTTTKEGEVTEKAVSKKQRGLMGAAYSVEKGDKKLKDIPKSYREKVKNVVNSMTKKQVGDFAKTSDDELKNKKKTTEKVNKEDIKKLEESIIKLIDSHIHPNITKFELLNTIKKYKR